MLTTVAFWNVEGCLEGWSLHGEIGRLSGIRVFGLTCKEENKWLFNMCLKESHTYPIQQKEPWPFFFCTRCSGRFTITFPINLCTSKQQHGAEVEGRSCLTLAPCLQFQASPFNPETISFVGKHNSKRLVLTMAWSESSRCSNLAGPKQVWVWPVNDCETISETFVCSPLLYNGKPTIPIFAG